MWLLKILGWGCKLVIICCVVFWIVVPIVGLSSKKKSDKNVEWHSSRPYNRHQKSVYDAQRKAEILYQENKSKEEQKLTRKYDSLGIRPFGILSTTRKKTPDDAESEGYDTGYRQGVYDRENGMSEFENYDDATSYYNYYRTRYEHGYEEGYYDGYNN